MLEARDLKKCFGKRQAVAGISLQVGKGEIVGLLGPNGAGKTTTLSMLSGLLLPDAGEVRIDGQSIGSDTAAAKWKLGLVPQDLALYEELSAAENLRFFGSLYNLSGKKLAQAVHAALELVGLADRAADVVKDYSGGMKRRLNLAAALLHDPALILLDEPTVGIDPQSRNAIFDNIAALKTRGKAILYTTHYMEEAERLCDRIIIVDQGKVIANDTLSGLCLMAPAERRMVIEIEEFGKRNQDGTMTQALSSLDGVEKVKLEGKLLRVQVRSIPEVCPQVLGWLAENGFSYHHFATERPDLEAVFLSLTGRSLRDP